MPLPNSNALGGQLAIHGNDVWITDFNNDSLWRYNITSGQFTQFLVPEPAEPPPGPEARGAGSRAA